MKSKAKARKSKGIGKLRKSLEKQGKCVEE